MSPEDVVPSCVSRPGALVSDNTLAVQEAQHLGVLDAWSRLVLASQAERVIFLSVWASWRFGRCRRPLANVKVRSWPVLVAESACAGRGRRPSNPGDVTSCPRPGRSRGNPRLPIQLCGGTCSLHPMLPRRVRPIVDAQLHRAGPVTHSHRWW